MSYVLLWIARFLEELAGRLPPAENLHRVHHVAASSHDSAAWLTAGGTLFLGGATAVVALAAWKALRQLKVAVDELEEVRKDRHVQVFEEFSRRWASFEMAQALTLEPRYSRKSLAELFQKSDPPDRTNPDELRRYLRDSRHRVILIRIPNYFEDAAIIASVGGLDERFVHDSIGGVAVDTWRFWEPTIRVLQQDDAISYEKFERLVRDVEASDAARAAKPTEAS